MLKTLVALTLTLGAFAAPNPEMFHYTYEQRAELCEKTNPLAKQILQIIAEKKSNLILAADVTSKAKLLDLLEQTGDLIVILKTHCDIVEDWDDAFAIELVNLAKQKNVIIFEDRKFADIGNTALEQYRGGHYKIASWSDMVNAHTLPGDGVVSGLKEAGVPLGRASVLIAEMSSKGNLLSPEYTQQTISMANRHRDFVIGFICQGKITDDPCMIHMTPGVSLAQTGDTRGQQYNTPDYVIKTKKTDMIIVGRAIIEAQDPRSVAENYRKEGWQAYLDMKP
jgi:orotidine 5'-phosphate decarboxylase subfamily 1